MPTLRCWRLFFLVVFSVSLWTISPVQAQNKVDLLQAEGSPADVAQKLEQKLRQLMGQQSQIKLLDNPLSPMMARLTLGCVADTPDCMQRLAQMRSAQVLYHLRVLPAGGPMVLAMLRQIDGKTVKVSKAASHTFMTAQVDSAAQTLAQQIGLITGGTSSPTPRPPVVARPIPQPPVVARPEPRPPVVARPIPQPPVVARPEPRIRPIPRVVVPPVKRETRVALNPDGVTTKVAPPEVTPLWQKPMFWGWVSLGVAAAGTGIAISFGVLAGAKQSQVEQKLKDSQTGQALTYKQDIQPLEKEGQTNAVVSNVGTGIAVAGAVSAGVLFFIALTRKPAPAQPQTPPPSSRSGHYKLTPTTTDSSFVVKLSP